MNGLEIADQSDQEKVMVEYLIISVNPNTIMALLEIEDKELLNLVAYQSKILGDPNLASSKFQGDPDPLRLYYCQFKK